MLGFESVSLLEDFGGGVSPTFTIVSSRRYIRDINGANSSSTRISTLPPSFIISLAYRPQNNTVLRFLSSQLKTTISQSMSSPHPVPVAQNSQLSNAPESNSNSLTPLDVSNLDGSASGDVELEFDNGSGGIPLPVNETEDDSLASLLLSSTATYLKQESFLDLWTNISGNEAHNLVFMVVNGTVSSCLDGEFKLGDNGINLWNVNSSFDDESAAEEEEVVEVRFSDALHAVQSVVSMVVKYLMLGQLLLNSARLM